MRLSLWLLFPLWVGPHPFIKRVRTNPSLSSKPSRKQNRKLQSLSRKANIRTTISLKQIADMYKKSEHFFSVTTVSPATVTASVTSPAATSTAIAALIATFTTTLAAASAAAILTARLATVAIAVAPQSKQRDRDASAEENDCAKAACCNPLPTAPRRSVALVL
eukprot:CAMPEP_0197635196 /NCGR_PEP_ID=MMETSP1338-20131121/11077_1 /TAXON_ID=43686 ORGANISM="Pelagodinium beii, Strain RCC1491" /NCGR_SAMPLE_ID=MMETSP1338 /ASSEMBLY_ACC=CAM_ASM_000754 /LENGTH=163 /DNA_ID=CAMNT_0043207201 /DNA_START=108 /DNA_END=600 /DNA_ORIENTATION=+